MRIALLLLSAFGSVACGFFGPGSEETSRRPNILLVTVDALRADRLEPYGYGAVSTPAFSEVARAGVLCAQAVTPVPVTLPAHASLMTGLYPARHGVRANGLLPLAEDAPVLAEILKKHGYRTGAFVGASVLDRRFGLDRGFDVYDDGGMARLSPHHFAERRAEDVARPALRWMLDESQKGSFFAWLHLFDPHKEYAPPEPFSEIYSQIPYDGEVAYVDHTLQQIFTIFGHQGLMRETLVVLTADHGESLGEHGENTHGLLLYDATVRVPLILSHPDLPRGRRVESQVRLIDLLPTLCDFLGVPAPGTDGRSFLPGAEGKPQEELPCRLESLAGRFLYNWPAFRGVRTPEWKYIRAVGEELYRLPEDARETRNVFEKKPQEAARLAEALEGMEKEFPTLAPPEPPGGEEAGPPPPSREALMEIPREITAARDEIRTGRRREGIARLEALIEKNPSCVDALRVLAEAYVETGEREKSLKNFDRAVALSRAYDDALHLGRAQCLAGLGRMEQAMEEVRAVLARVPRHVEAHLLAGELALEAGERDEARRHFEGTLSLRPDEPKALYALGVLLLEEEKFDEASKFLQTAARVLSEAPVPDAFLSADVLAALGAVSAAQGRCDEADEFLRGALQLNEDHLHAHFALGRCLFADGKFSEASEHLRRYLALDTRPGTKRRAEAQRMMGTMEPFL
jgi:arylsulfatase A-like enzyme/Tfp pilus assembly protein PilF